MCNCRHSQILALIVMLFVIACIAGCDSSGSATSPGEGTVAVVMTDAGNDHFTSIILSVWKIELIDDHRAYPLFEVPRDEPVEIDLLSLAEFDDVFMVNENVPAGKYGKVRLHVDEIDFSPEPAEPIVLPGEKLDLNPRGAIEVVPGDTLVIELDFDMKKTLLVKRDGILRPIVFVNVVIAESPDPFPSPGTVYDDNVTRVTGEILELNADTNDYNVKPEIGDGFVNVILENNCNVYSINANGELTKTQFSHEYVESIASAYGWFCSESHETPHLYAHAVQVGDSFLQCPLRGQVTLINSPEQTLQFESRDEVFDVDYSQATLFTCCGEVLLREEFEALEIPFEARIDGYIIPETNQLMATVVVAKVCGYDQAWSGVVQAMNREQQRFTIRADEGGETCLQLVDPEGVVYQLMASGELLPRKMAALEESFSWRVWAFGDGQKNGGCVDVDVVITEQF